MPDGSVLLTETALRRAWDAHDHGEGVMSSDPLRRALTAFLRYHGGAGRTVLVQHLYYVIALQPPLNSDEARALAETVVSALFGDPDA